MGVNKMVAAIMDMTSGARLDDVEVYGEEVLNANWLPQPMLQLGLQTVAEANAEQSRGRKILDGLVDPEGFLRRLYLAQE